VHVGQAGEKWEKRGAFCAVVAERRAQETLIIIKHKSVHASPEHIGRHLRTLDIAVYNRVQIALIVAHAGHALVHIFFFNLAVSERVVNVSTTLSLVVFIDVVARRGLAAQSADVRPTAAQREQQKTDAS